MRYGGVSQSAEKQKQGAVINGQDIHGRSVGSAHQHTGSTNHNLRKMRRVQGNSLDRASFELK